MVWQWTVVIEPWIMDMGLSENMEFLQSGVFFRWLSMRMHLWCCFSLARFKLDALHGPTLSVVSFIWVCLKIGHPRNLLGHRQFRYDNRNFISWYIPFSDIPTHHYSLLNFLFWCWNMLKYESLKKMMVDADAPKNPLTMGASVPQGDGIPQDSQQAAQCIIKVPGQRDIPSGNLT